MGRKTCTCTQHYMNVTSITAGYTWGIEACGCMTALFPGHSHVLSHSCGVNSIFLHSCKIKSGGWHGNGARCMSPYFSHLCSSSPFLSFPLLLFSPTSFFSLYHSPLPQDFQIALSWYWHPAIPRALRECHQLRSYCCEQRENCSSVPAQPQAGATQQCRDPGCYFAARTKGF